MKRREFLTAACAGLLASPVFGKTNVPKPSKPIVSEPLIEELNLYGINGLCIRNIPKDKKIVLVSSKESQVVEVPMFKLRRVEHVRHFVLRTIQRAKENYLTEDVLTYVVWDGENLGVVCCTRATILDRVYWLRMENR